MRNSLLATLTLLVFEPSLARADCEAPVTFGVEKFGEQLKKSDYRLIFAGEVVNAPAWGEEGEALVSVHNVIVTKDHVPELLPDREGQPPILKLRKSKGVRLDKGRSFLIFARKENNNYVLRECNHSHPVIGHSFGDIAAETAAIRAALPPTPFAAQPTTKPAQKLP